VGAPPPVIAGTPARGIPAFPPGAPPPPPPAPPPAPPRPAAPSRSAGPVSVDLVDEIEDLDDHEPADAFGATVAQTGNLFVRANDGRILGPFSPDEARELVLQGRLTGGEAASFDQRSWMPLTSFPGLSGLAMPEANPPPRASGGEFDFSFSDAPKTNAGAEPDDFDFSFSDLPKTDRAPGLVPPPATGARPAAAAPPPAARPATGSPTGSRPATGLHDLFDDLPDDLPAPKGAAAAPAPAGGLTDLSDLPAPKTAVTPRAPSGGLDLPGLRDAVDLPGLKGGVDLPGLKGEAGLPGLKGEAGLPGLKGEAGLPGLRGEPGLPGPRGVAGLPGTRGETGLPGVRGESALPGVRGETGLPGVPELSGLVAPVGEDLPNLPGDAEARQFAEGGLADQLEGDPLRRPAAPAAGRKRTLILAAGLVGGLAVVGAVTSLIDGVGPFGLDLLLGDEPVAAPRTAPPSMNVAAPSAAPSALASAPVSGAGSAPGLLPPGEATLAEVAGYRAAIAAREQKGEGAGAEALDLIELYAFGALEFPGNNEWIRRAGELAAKLDDATKATPAGKRARLAAALANSDGAALADAIEVAKANPGDARAHYLAGHAWRLKNDLDATFAAFDKARTLDPTLLAAARLAGETAVKRGDMENARPILEGVFEKAPGTPSVAVSLARIELHKGANDRASQLVEQVLAMPAERATAADRSQAIVLRARLEIGRGQEDVALRSLEEAIKANPRNLEAIELLSERHFATKAYDKALNQFETLRAAGAGTPEIVISIARCHEALNNADKALAELTAGAAQYAQSAALQSAIGDAEMRRRRFPEARAAYDKALSIDPKFEEAYLRIADLLVSQAKVGEASDFLAKALEAKPSSAMLHYGAGELKQRLAGGKDETLLGAAEREFREAIRLDPTMLRARHHLAQTLLDKGDAQGAMKELTGLQARPDYHEDLAYDVGRAQQALGEIDNAIASYEDALTRHGNDPKTLLAAGTAYFAKADYPKATERLTLAAQVANKLTAAHYYLGRVAFEQKNLAVAVQKFQLASDDEAGNNEFRYWLGRALLEAGKAKPAYQEFTTVAENIKNENLKKIPKFLCDAHYRRGQLRFDGVADGTRDWRGAQGDFKVALDCDESRPEVWTALGDTYEIPEPKTAEQHYTTATRKDAKYAPAYWKRGNLRMLSENVAGAKADFERARDLDPKSPEPLGRLCEIYNGQGQKAQAKAACKAYLDVAPSGELAGTAREILEDLNR
jgi:tetratricopeptide (TPR) repeat protein